MKIICKLHYFSYPAFHPHMKLKASTIWKKNNLMKNLVFIVGYCFGLSFHESHSTCPYHGEALPHPGELWIHSSILHPTSRWSHNLIRYSGETGPRKSTSSGIQAQRQWSLPFLLEATVTQQDSNRDSADCIVKYISMKVLIIHEHIFVLIWLRIVLYWSSSL